MNFFVAFEDTVSTAGTIKAFHHLFSETAWPIPIGRHPTSLLALGQLSSTARFL
jgi:hypothetical protein